ncbi:glycosyltransferase family 4 protein [Candidatus Collierbacteria bacterium]|nr:glycosyltransferase family 4 protein [Candidatus Collierbacteria bacterium]
MRIGIDARFYGIKDTGIGRYVQNLILNLGKIDKINQYIIFGGEIVRDEIKNFKNFKWVKLHTKPYSIAEQLANPIIFAKEKLDLLHVPHFNAPIFYQGRYIITIHDLIKHLSIGRATTTLPYYQYLIKHLAYRFSIRVNLSRADKIIVPAFFWKDYLMKHFGLSEEKIFVTYESATKSLLNKNALNPLEVLNKYNLNKPYVIYTGNLYPHKNVPFLIEAIRHFNASHEHRLELALACARNDIFKNAVETDETIKFLGFVPDEELAALYAQALALIQPSLIEGFGLTGLEAMSVGLPVLSSNSTCLPEIYGDAALYFDPKNTNDLVSKLAQFFSDQELSINLIAAGNKRVKQFSWQRMARQTLAVYKL